MEEGTLSVIFICCMAGGLVIPVLDIVSGALGGALDFDVDFDADGAVPVSLMSISFSAVVFGAVGRLLLLFHLPPLLCVALAAVLGILGGWAVMRFIIRPLKKSFPRAQSIRDLRWKEGVVKLGVRPDFTGTITVLSATGSKVTYSARPAPWVEGEIPPGTEVLIVEIDEGEGVCVVCPMDVPRPANKK